MSKTLKEKVIKKKVKKMKKKMMFIGKILPIKIIVI